MAWDATKPVNSSSLVAADVRANLVALHDDGIVQMSGSSGEINDITATPAEINAACDGSTAKNGHIHPQMVLSLTGESAAGTWNSFVFTWSTTGWSGTAYPFYVYLPHTNYTTLTAYFYCSESGTGTGQARLQLGGQYTAACGAWTGVPPTWQGSTGTITSLSAGWNIGYIDLYCSNGAASTTRCNSVMAVVT